MLGDFDSISSRYRGLKFNFFVKFDENWIFQMPITLFFRELIIIFSMAPKSKKPPQKIIFMIFPPKMLYRGQFLRE